MIDIDYLSSHYVVAKPAVAAIDDVNLRIEQGGVFGLVGASGAGKSTLIVAAF